MTNTSGDDQQRTVAPPPYVPAQRGGHGRPAMAAGPSTLPAAQHRTAPTHATATASMVVGILALALSPGFGLSLLASPVAWWLGRHSLREIDASGDRWSGRTMAQAGMITGIVGTVLLAVAVLAVVAMFVFLFRYDGSHL